MSDDPELKNRMEEVSCLLSNGWPSLTNLNDEFALHIRPDSDLRIVTTRIADELRQRKCTVYCLSGGRSSAGEVVVIVKFRKNK